VVGFSVIRAARAVLLALGLIGGVLVGSAVAANNGKWVVVKPKWRLVNPQLGHLAAASERYVLFTKSQITSRMTLLDEQTGKTSKLSVPDRSCFGSRTFGGPWLMVQGCNSRNSQPIWLYNLTSRRWLGIDVTYAAQVDSIGRYWIRFVSPDPQCIQDLECGVTAYLQNIETGAVKLDPAAPGGRIYDDLNTPTGSRPLCAPLREPASKGHGSLPGSLTFFGHFAITAGNDTGTYLRRCGSPLDLPIDGYSVGANPRAVMWDQLPLKWHPPLPNVRPIVGRFLPSLQRFTIRVPAAIDADGGGLIAMTKRTIYVGSNLPVPGGFCDLGDACRHIWAAHLHGN
jgi:hypothetical protein